MRAAASSMASGSPSRRTQISAMICTFAGVMRKCKEKTRAIYAMQESTNVLKQLLIGFKILSFQKLQFPNG